MFLSVIGTSADDCILSHSNHNDDDDDHHIDEELKLTMMMMMMVSQRNVCICNWVLNSGLGSYLSRDRDKINLLRPDHLFDTAMCNCMT